MDEKDCVWDVIIVGAGAAGLMAALTCRRYGSRVLLFDSKQKIGAKILMSGGTRCNVTNKNIDEKDYESENKRIVARILKAFSSEQAVTFFEKLGVDVVLEPGGKFFPSTHSGKTILEALMREIHKTGVVLETGRKVQRIENNNEIFYTIGDSFLYRSKTVIVCTGGLSFPATGSDGAGYQMAESFGHNIIATSPSLTPLETNDKEFKALSGMSIPVRLTLTIDGKRKAGYEGSFLFTHFGFSGPAVLNISRHWIRAPKTSDIKLAANFLPAESEESFRKNLEDAAVSSPKRLVQNFLGEKLPDRFIRTVFHKLGLEDAVLNQFKREARESLIRHLFHFPLSITGALGYNKAEVTAGGVDLREVDPVTLESKKRPGLFFAGEILDVDGRIGGYNFQWAWSSGFAAGTGAARRAETMGKRA